jgi:hypothetical protein
MNNKNKYEKVIGKIVYYNNEPITVTKINIRKSIPYVNGYTIPLYDCKKRKVVSAKVRREVKQQFLHKVDEIKRIDVLNRLDRILTKVSFYARIKNRGKAKRTYLAQLPKFYFTLMSSRNRSLMSSRNRSLRQRKDRAAGNNRKRTDGRKFKFVKFYRNNKPTSVKHRIISYKDE